MTTTRERLLEHGLGLLLAHGYNDLGIQTLLNQTGVPKGSFYHHFRSKQDFALAVVDCYMDAVHATLDQCLGDSRLAPFERIRAFFAHTEAAYREQGYLGCLLGGLGQELSGVNETFRRRIEECIGYIAGRLAECLKLAKARGDLATDADCDALADVLANCWEGAALRSRLRRSSVPLANVLDFYFSAVAAQSGATTSYAKQEKTA